MVSAHSIVGTAGEHLDPVALLQHAVRINTVNPPGNEVELAKFLQQILENAGVTTDLRRTADGRANLTATLVGNRLGPRLVLSGHLDTVPIGERPWTHGPFDGECVGDRLYGRGTADMKGGLLALLMAFLRTSEAAEPLASGELVFAASFGEETGSQGARRMIDDGQLGRFDAMIIAEPSSNRLVTAHKGVVWVRVKATGRTGHSSAPDQGVNAVDAILRFRAALAHLALPEATDRVSAATVATTGVEGGKGYNLIPDSCSLTLDFRTLPNQSHTRLIERLEEIARGVAADTPGAEIAVEPILNLAGMETEQNTPLVRAALAALRQPDGSELSPESANYFTDASVYQEIGGDIVIIGPGRADQAHQTDEFIEVSEYIRSIEIYNTIIGSYLGRAKASPKTERSV